MNQDLANQSVAVLGLGASGEAAARLLLAKGAQVTALDTGDAASLRDRAAALVDAGARVILGEDALHEDAPQDLAVLSPGIDPDTALPAGVAARGVPMIAEIELAFGFCACPVVAVTGTNGKTTTTGLVAEMLGGAGFRVAPGGNYGTPFSALVDASAAMDYLVLEVSSFQLEKIRTFRPRVSVWLNIAPDHLDRYPSFEAYRAAKLRIFDCQDAGDYAVVNATDALPEIKPERITFDAHGGSADFTFTDGRVFYRGDSVLKMSDTRLAGEHNAENLMAALGVARALDVPFERAAPGLCRFAPQPHRCEPVAEIGGVLFVNDSKATNLHALACALAGDRPVVLIAGGKDKGIDFGQVADLVARRVRAAVLIGEMRARIAACWSAHTPCREAADLADAVEIARELSHPGDVVLFSPGTSSFDMFRNYEDRGDQFRALIRTHQHHDQ